MCVRNIKNKEFKKLLVITPFFNMSFILLKVNKLELQNSSCLNLMHFTEPTYVVV